MPSLESEACVRVGQAAAPSRQYRRGCRAKVTFAFTLTVRRRAVKQQVGVARAAALAPPVVRARPPAPVPLQSAPGSRAPPGSRTAALRDRLHARRAWPARARSRRP